MARVTVMTLFLLGFFVALLILQCFLSRAESRWPGLILPACALLYSLVLCLNIADTGDVLQNIVLLISTFLAGNLSTGILLAVYGACRAKHRKKKQLDKMSIRDLN